jgi:hypothetical protein
MATNPATPEQSDRERALALRRQAQTLLGQAETLDGLRPYLVVHVHEYGSGLTIAWAAQDPTQEQIRSVLPAEFNPERGEWIAFSETTLLDVVGLEVTARIADVQETLEALARLDNEIASHDDAIGTLEFR